MKSTIKKIPTDRDIRDGNASPKLLNDMHSGEAAATDSRSPTINTPPRQALPCSRKRENRMPSEYSARQFNGEDHEAIPKKYASISTTTSRAIALPPNVLYILLSMG